MSKNKKSHNKKLNKTEKILLATAMVQLITAITDLIEHLLE